MVGSPCKHIRTASLDVSNVNSFAERSPTLVSNLRESTLYRRRIDDSTIKACSTGFMPHHSRSVLPSSTQRNDLSVHCIMPLDSPDHRVRTVNGQKSGNSTVLRAKISLAFYIASKLNSCLVFDVLC